MDRTRSEQLRGIADRVRAERVMERIGLLADRARNPGGGVSRLAFSPRELEAMDLVARWMEEAGLTVAADAVGNLFGSTDRNAEGAETILAGSHLDSVPDGGAYDGVLGVMGAIEAVEAMRAAGFRPHIPMEVVVWRCEEGPLGQGRLGSLFHVGELSLEAIRRMGTEQVPIDRYLDLVRDLPGRAAGRRTRGLLELHIEQGRRLDESGTTIGVVTAIPGATRWRMTLQGRTDHSGATPMGMRRDALGAAAEIVLAVEAAGMAERSHETVATATSVRCLPGAWNVVAGWAEVLIDVRGTDQASVDRALDAIREAATDSAGRRRVQLSMDVATRGRPVRLDESVVARVEHAARALGLSAVRMPSGAGHDAQTIAPHAPTGMIFIPSVEGISHAPQESSRPEDIRAGVRVLAMTWADLAS